ncbi:hypothetical protein U0Q17_00948 [Lactiplantibacillus plantarum]|nr:hypothetical protein [Lactiplantibacillus plantarum]MCG0700407.1 hypothetical protein [Lactiplantibacillus plantarum]MCG0703424.1 hypothetical protein [Lactiplantibacillus plantarum]MCG0706379.1 hypothetical protein [Lactiplantibacillus plantarum]MCG0721489.1 hypothetical protein [Lactiplantibacillus plantarum]
MGLLFGHGINGNGQCVFQVDLRLGAQSLFT